MTQEQAEDTAAKLEHWLANDGMLLVDVRYMTGNKMWVWSPTENLPETIVVVASTDGTGGA